MRVMDIRTIKSSSFGLKPVAAAITLSMAAVLPMNVAFANGAFGTNTDISGATINVPTYYANSPQGVQKAFDPITHAYSTTGVTVDTGVPLRKFVDPLAGAYNGLDGAAGKIDLDSGIPVAIAEHNWTNPLTGAKTADDYYEIAVVEYVEKMHSDLPKQTRLRGYVQIETPNLVPVVNGGAVGLKDVTTVIGSEHIPATYPDKTPIYKWKQDPVTGVWAQSNEQVYWVHQPHYLGPVILSAKGTAARIKFTNYLPYNDANGNSVGSATGQGGEAFVPVDETIAGGGPVFDAKGKPMVDVNGRPIKFSQNRAAIHWHGGDAPWISDGTPHQWFAPAGDVSYSIVDAMHPNGMGKGDSAANVPDMAEPGPGSYTLYFPNNLSGRLMMYHDHVSGLTKVNVYEGEAAGYVVYDMVELGLVANAIGASLAPVPVGVIPTGLLDAVGIPLVIQDKTFVPKNIGPNAVASDGTSQSQDTKWDLAHWGQPGDLYFPHVYETNQDPNSIDGTNPVGRWDWGPWFWPVFPSQYSLPTGVYGDVTATPEAFMDTAVVNGQAYPTLTVDPKTYRFRILSVGNDRTLNLGLYQAVDAAQKVCDGKSVPTVAAAVPGGLPPVACTEVRMVQAVPTPGYPATWPVDGRVGGVPDPATAGPDIIQIGSEGGLLPAVAVHKSQPVTYESNVRSITVFNVQDSDLLLGGGERADVLIDFSRYAGQTLILYNDAPAPMPGYDPRIDYYTGLQDNTAVGGSYKIPEGYGPNTRTIMQFKVSNAAPAAPLNVAALAAALPAAYAATQPAPIIPEVVYNAPFGTAGVNNYAQIYTGSATLPNFTYTVDPYLDAAGVLQTTKSLPVINKAIQELFDPIYGRMNSTLAVELPFSSATVATTIPLAYIDTPVDSLDGIKDGETQIWKITHNGVDDHPVHFHMVNVQVINRVGWDGTVKPPHENELGWKETLMMNPLEDVYVAVRAVRPVTPFGVPKSSRLLDPSQIAGSTLGFTQVDPVTGQAPTTQTQLVGGVSVPVKTTAYANKLTDFDNEYVWHCHILGHEEQDFMRPFIFHPNVVRPDAPANVQIVGTKLVWTDTTPFGGQDAEGIPTAGTNAAYPAPISSPKNEIGFKLNVSVDGGVTFNPVLDASGKTLTFPANTTSWDGANSAYQYQVVAFNVAGDSLPGTSATTTTAGALVGVGVVTAPVSYVGSAPVAVAGPTGLTLTLNADGSVTVSWIALIGATGYQVSVNGGVAVAVATTTYTVPKGSLKVGTNTISVAANTLNGTTDVATATLYNAQAVAPVAFVASTSASKPGVVTLNWANSPLNVNNVTGLMLSWTHNGVAVSKTFAPTATGATIINLTSAATYGIAAATYNFKLQAISNLKSSGTIATVPAGTVAP